MKSNIQQYILSAEIALTNFLPVFFPEVVTGSLQDWRGLDTYKHHDIGNCFAIVPILRSSAIQFVMSNSIDKF